MDVGTLGHTIGQRLFSEIDDNPYLNKLYAGLLYNYALKLFRIENVEKRPVKLIDVLRFADLLSKSDDPKKAESHHTWAQEIIALAEELYGETALLKVYKDSILSSTGNYQGLDLRFERNPEYLVPRYDPLEQMYFEYSKELYLIPSEPDKYFFRVQKDIYDHFEDQYVSYSAPTSLGKSYLMRLLIKEKIQNGEKCNFALLVPTKALINEVTEKLTNELESLLQEQDYRIVNSAGSLALKDKTHHFIFVVTPERMLYVMSDPEAVPIDYMFVDEAHKISERDGRSAFYYKVVQMAVQNKTKKAHVFFASPSIANPEVFFRVIPEWERQQDYSLATQYAPVSQEKFIVDFRENGIYIVNDRKDEIERVAGLPEGLEWIDFLFETGSGMRNIVYCSGRDSGIRNARLYAEKLDPLNIQELDELSDLIKETVHEDYYLADLVKKGVAYHMGYLPTTIRMRIEELYRENKIRTIFCTRTLLEGVNLPADNLFITSKKSGGHELNAVDFRNLVGRVGRIEFNLYGNVFLLCLKRHTKFAEYEALVKADVPALQLPFSAPIMPEQMKEIVSKLSQGVVPSFEDINEKDVEKNAQNAFLRRIVNMLLHDIVKGKKSRILHEFRDYLDDDTIELIKEKFLDRADLIDDDINSSVDQNERLRDAIMRGQIPIPPRSSTHRQMLDFLEKLCDVFMWEHFEKFTLGYKDKDGNHSRLRWYAKLILLWTSGKGIKHIINDSLDHCKETGEVWIYGRKQNYDPSSDGQKNQVIGNVLQDIDDILLFRLSTYFLRFASVYKTLHSGMPPVPDWYEFIEYGTTLPLPIFLQRNGFSRESAIYIIENNDNNEYVDYDEDGSYLLHMSLLTCPDFGVRKDAKKVYYNIRELFVEE